MTDLRSYSQRSEGPTVDTLELALTGSASLTDDLRRTQEVEITVRGTVVGHAFNDKYDKNGDIAQTVKTAKVKVDELVDIVILTVPRRMKGQTAMNVDGTIDVGEDVVVHDAGGRVIYRGEEVDADDVPDAVVVGELEAGPRPEGVDENGEVLGDAPHGDPQDDPTAPVDRHPQVPEAAWSTLNREQKADVAERMERVARQNATVERGENVTDVEAARTHLARALQGLRDDYGIELLDAAEIEALDDVLPADEPPPPPVGVQSPPMSVDTLRRRRTYLLAKQGLPAEADDARREELAEIDLRLNAQGAPA